MELYRNKNYKVVYDQGVHQYQVIHLITGAIEGEHMELPKALTTSHIFNDAIERFRSLREKETTDNVIAIGTARKDPAE